MLFKLVNYELGDLVGRCSASVEMVQQGLVEIPDSELPVSYPAFFCCPIIEGEESPISWASKQVNPVIFRGNCVHGSSDSPDTDQASLRSKLGSEVRVSKPSYSSPKGREALQIVLRVYSATSLGYLHNRLGS